MSSKPFEELKLTGRLPSPPGVAVAILRLTQGEDFSTTEIARVIQADPALTGRLLKVTNSSRHAAIKPIGTVDEAVNRLGIQTVRTVALGFSLISAFRDGGCPTFDYDVFWSESLARAIAAQEIGKKLPPVDAGEAYCCGILAGIGRLALACVHPERYAEVIEGATGNQNELARLEQEAFDIDHREVSEALLVDWGLPATHTRCVRLFDDRQASLSGEDEVTRGLVRVIRSADMIARCMVPPEHMTTADANDLATLPGELGCALDEFDSLCDCIIEMWSDWGQVLSLPTAAVRTGGLVGLAGPLEGEERTEDTKIKIVVADDDRLTLRLLEHNLGSAGYEVYCAENGRQALDLALQTDPDILVSDWNMPEMDGLELCAALRSWEPGRAKYVIILTGRDEEDRVVEAFDAGIDDYVTKPFNPRVLLARVRAGERVVRLQDRVAADKKRVEEHAAQLGVMNRKLQQASVTDTLTGLMNRRYAMDRLNEAWTSRKRTGRPLAAIMIDIDHFKQINDRFGHDVGDAVLRETARVFREQIRRHEVVCRIGGEEFLVLCPDADAEAAAVGAERIRAAVEANEVSAGGFRGGVTISLGVADTTDEHATVNDLLKAADEAVYESKRNGRNRVTVAPAPVGG